MRRNLIIRRRKIEKLYILYLPNPILKFLLFINSSPPFQNLEFDVKSNRFENILIQESITSLFLQRLLINQDEVLIQFFNSERINKSTLTKLRDQYHLTLKETQSPNHWNKYRISEIAANMVYELIDSQTFRNIFENVVRNRGENVSMENLIKIIIPLVNKEYEKFAQQYKTENWETLKCSSQIVLWQRVNQGNVRNELDFLQIKQND
ncbi:10411_t:CDS:2 [Gigaspora rosea]|nr:10411_t:CDS:2 [Gigaspora rosea]